MRRAAAIIALAAIVLAALTIVLVYPRHRWPPHPEGMVLRIALGRIETPMSRIIVEPVADGRPAFIVHKPSDSGDEEELYEVLYPGGETRSMQDRPLATSPTQPFDFDGDGTPDRIQMGRSAEFGWVEVLSGANGERLFLDEDPLEYENETRAFSLGDLDGDGFSELALTHPRMDRSRYDFEPADATFGARSWVTIVSGSRVCR